MGPEGEGTVCVEDGRGILDGFYRGEGGDIFGGGEETVEGIFQGSVEFRDRLESVEVYKGWLH